MRASSRTVEWSAIAAAVATVSGCEIELPGSRHYDEWRVPATTEVEATFGAHGFEALVDLHVAGPPDASKSHHILNLYWELHIDPAPDDAGVVSTADDHSFGLRVDIAGASESELASEEQDSVPNPDLCDFPIAQDIAFPEIRQSITLRCDDVSVCTRDLKVKISAVRASATPPASAYRLVFNAALNGLGAGIPETAELEWSDAKITQLRDHLQTAGSFCP